MSNMLSTTEESTNVDIDKPLYILIIKAESNRVAVIVDQILGSEEIVVKPMPEYFRQMKNFSGTSILGDGAIAMIIDVQGYIQKNQLGYTELQKDNTVLVQHKVEQEPQSLLIFDNNTEEHFALALSWIRRIDSLDVKRIQMIAGSEYIEYRGEQMRLLRLENCLPVQKPNNYAAIANIIIPKRSKIPVALLINRVVDTKSTVIKLENTSMKNSGILGSMLLDEKITLMLDLHSILEAGEPDSVEKLEINTEKAKNKHILLVEDTPFFMKVIKECIEAGGYQVTTANNGREGLEALQQQDFDLVLSDIEMPLMDGREMVKNIRANSRWDKLPVIALTTLNDEHTIAEGKKAGFNEWLVKLDKELVLKTLARYSA
jgi:two-component system chemotaxis sensor kinase CheA